MRALIVALLSLAVLAGCATTPEVEPFAKNPKDPTEPKTGDLTFTPAGQGVCRANKAVLGILIDADGVLTKFACNKVGNGGPGGGPKTKQERFILDHDSSLELGKVFIDLGPHGTLTKWVIPGTTDPCYVWVIGGHRYHVCW